MNEPLCEASGEADVPHCKVDCARSDFSLSGCEFRKEGEEEKKTIQRSRKQRQAARTLESEAESTTGSWVL